MSTQITNLIIERDLIVKIQGIRPDRSLRGRTRMAWAVLRGQEIGRPVVVTNCVVGREMRVQSGVDGGQA